MATFIFKTDNFSDVRGFDRTVTVYKVVNNIPRYIGKNDRIQAGATYGDIGEAVQVIARETSYKLKDSYSLVNKSVRIYRLGSTRNLGSE